MEAQRGQATCPRSHSRMWLSLGTNPCLSAPWAHISYTTLDLQAHLLNISHAYVSQQAEKMGKLGRIPRK